MAAAEQVPSVSGGGPAQPASLLRTPPDDAKAIGAAAEFLALPGATMQPQVTWSKGRGDEWAGQLAVDVPAAQDAPAHTVALEVEAGSSYYVRSAQSPAYPGLEASEVHPNSPRWQVAWDFTGRHFRPWPPAIAGDTRPSHDRSADVFWYHAADHLVRTGTWALTELRTDRAEGRVWVYASRYRARRAPRRSLAEMKVDLLDAMEVVRTRVQAHPGAIFLFSYGVPVLSHPASPKQNPAWEIRYFVGPGGPRPIIRWAAVDATDGSLIYIDHEAPDTCFESDI